MSEPPKLADETSVTAYPVRPGDTVLLVSATHRKPREVYPLGDFVFGGSARLVVKRMLTFAYSILHNEVDMRLPDVGGETAAERRARLLVAVDEQWVELTAFDSALRDRRDRERDAKTEATVGRCLLFLAEEVRGRAFADDPHPTGRPLPPEVWSPGKIRARVEQEIRDGVRLGADEKRVRDALAMLTFAFSGLFDGRQVMGGS